MAEILDMVDLEALRKEVREEYREVAEDRTRCGVQQMGRTRRRA